MWEYTGEAHLGDPGDQQPLDLLMTLRHLLPSLIPVSLGVK